MKQKFYIRRYRDVDQHEVIRIWYDESLRVHSFIPAQFWEGHKETLINQYLPESETFVAEQEDRVLGFISLVGNYIGALFVDTTFHNQGIGTALIDYAHKLRGSLFVDVYKENTCAYQFYQRYGFIQKREKIQPETGYVTITMYIGPIQK